MRPSFYSSEENHRWTSELFLGKQAPKIHVRGDNHTLFLDSSGKHFGIRRGLPSNLSEVNNIVTCSSQALSQFGR
jgi:hypothetical protein